MGMQPNYAILDAAAVGPNLEIQESGLVVVGNAPALTTARKIRGSMPKTSGVWGFEVAYFGDDAPAGLIAYGICTALSALNAGTGVDASSYGYRAADGGIYQNNAALVAAAACPATPPKTYVSIVANLNTNTMLVYQNGSPVASTAISPATGGRVYYPSFTPGSVTASTGDHVGIGLYVNFGQRDFAYPIPGVSGWFNQPRPPSPIYMGPVGDSAYSSAATDTPANRNYDQVLLNVDDFSIDKSAGVWIWRDKNASETYGTFDIDSSGGFGRQLLEQDYRDAPVIVRLVPYNSTLAAGAYTLATVLVDRVEAIGESVIRVYLKGKRSSLQRGLQRRYFPPWADKGVAGRVVPILVGAGRSIDLGSFLVDQANRVYQISDSAVANIGVVRDKGNALDPNAAPPQFTPTNDLQGLIAQTLPAGKFTADASTTGSQNQYPGAPDVLQQIGTNWDSAWTASTPPPPGWTVTNTDLTPVVSTAVKQGPPQGYLHNMIYLGSNRALAAVGSAKEFSFRPTTPLLRPNKTYKISFNMINQSGGGQAAGGGVIVLSAWSAGAKSWISGYQTPIIGNFDTTEPVVLTYTVPPGGTRNVLFSIVGANGQQASALIWNIVVEELASAVTNVPLQGCTLEYYERQILSVHAGLDDSEWSAADCQALDAAYPGSPLGVNITEPTNVDAAAMLPLDSMCAVMQEDRFGVLRFRRLADPRLATPLATYDESQLDFPVTISLDYAEGLTQSFGCQRNGTLHTDSDFVSDFLLVPAALRTQLKRSSRIIKKSNVQLRNSFQFAALAAALETYFDDEVITLAELVRVNSWFATNRPGGLAPRFILSIINYDGYPPEYLFGDVIALNYTSLGGRDISLSAQQNVATVATKLLTGQQKLQHLGWG